MKYTVVAENGALELTCFGSYKLQWDIPSSVDRNRRQITATNCKSSCDNAANVAQRHTSILRISQTATSDTGRYECVFKKFEVNREENVTSTSIYVYIASQGKNFIGIRDRGDGEGLGGL